MIETETRQMLAYLQAADNRNIGAADIAFWMDAMPAWLDLDTAKAAIRMFFTEPERDAATNTWFTPRHMIRCAKSVRRQRETERAREAAKRPAIEAAYTPPAEGWKARVPGGWKSAPEEPAEAREPAPEPDEFTEAEMAANRAKLQALIAGRLDAGNLVDPALKDGNTK